jgi:hypothetical protein
MTIIKEGGVKRRENDFYETPLAFAATAMYNIPCAPMSVKTALDPGAGRGVWGRALRRFNPTCHIAGIDIQPPSDLIKDHDVFGQVYDEWHYGDFLEWETKDKYDLIMGNPPYKLVHEFVDKSFGLLAPHGQLVFLMRLAMLESQKRYKTWWTHSPIKKVFVSPRRISFTGDGKSDDTAYALFVWQEGYEGATLLDWIWWDYDNIPCPVTVSSWNIPVRSVPDWHYTVIDKEG